MSARFFFKLCFLKKHIKRQGSSAFKKEKAAQFFLFMPSFLKASPRHSSVSGFFSKSKTFKKDIRKDYKKRPGGQKIKRPGGLIKKKVPRHSNVLTPFSFFKSKTFKKRKSGKHRHSNVSAPSNVSACLPA